VKKQSFLNNSFWM